jgi:hypothetical protein
MERPIWLLLTSLAISLPLVPLSAQEVRAGGIVDGVVSDTSLVPLAGVEVSIQRTTIRVVTGENGRFRINGLPSGSYLVVARHMGFRPVAQLAGVAAGDTLRLSILMETANASLDTIRINANADPTGFARRRGLGVGQFITAADIARENPRTTTSLIRTRDAMRYTLDQSGHPFVAMSSGPRRICTPLVLLDGFPVPAGSVPSAAGVPTMDWALHPAEIGGVEIYVNPSQVPAQFATFRERADPDCGVIVFWTRERLGIPATSRSGPP